MDVTKEGFAFEFITWVANASFQELCLKHNEMCHIACKHSQEGNTHAFWRASNAANIVKSAMWLQHPNGAAAWFNSEES